MSHRHVPCLAIGLLLATSLPAAPVPTDTRSVKVEFLGGKAGAPLEGVTVRLYLSTGNWSDDMRRTPVEAATDKTGTAAFALAPGRYYVRLHSAKEYPYLTLPPGHKGHPNHFSRVLVVGAAAAQASSFTLADACKLTLRAVDADTGKGIPGVEFATENALGEIWGEAIEGDNLGAKNTGKVTDADGTFTRLVGPRPGYTYFPWLKRNGYELVGTHELELPTPVGTETKEHVFKFRKKK